MTLRNLSVTACATVLVCFLGAAGALGVTVGVTTVSAAELVTLATMAVTGALDPLVAEYQKESGHTVKVTYDTGPNLARRVAGGEAADVLIAPAAVVEQAIRDGRAVAASRVTIGQVGVGLAVRSGGRIPDISSTEALVQALLQADAVFYSQGTSGVYVGTLFQTLGIADRIKAKTTQVANGQIVVERVIADRGNAVGFTMVSEVKLMEPKGARLAGALPAAIQNYTTYTAAVMTSARDAAAARGLLAYITRPAARALFTATGWQ